MAFVVPTGKRVTRKDGQRFDHNPYGLMQLEAFPPHAVVPPLDAVGTARWEDLMARGQRPDSAFAWKQPLW